MKRLIAGGLLVLLLALALYASIATRTERNYRRLIAEGEAALAADDTSAAANAFSQAIEWKPDSMLGYLRRGEAYYRRNELEQALRDLRDASRRDPLATRPIELVGDVNLALGRYDRAAERYAAYVALDDRSAPVYYKLGLAEYRGGKVGSATTALRAALKIDDRVAEAHYLLGLCLRDQQRIGEAVRSLQRAVAVAPAMLHPREELADLYARLGRREERVNQLEALRALDPRPSREVALGLAYARAGQVNRAVLVLGHAAERFQDYPYAYVALGRVWLDLAQASGDRVALKKALGALEEAAGNDDSSEALMLFGRALVLAGDHELAERMLQQAAERLPVDPMAFYYYADVSERLGHAEVARRALLDYQALEGEDLDQRRQGALAVRIADLSARSGDAAAAVTWYQRAVALDLADADLLARMAEAQWRIGEVDAARATLARALDRDPSNRAARALRRRLR